jgi:anti-sigma-K factor RskA
LYNNTDISPELLQSYVLGTASAEEVIAVQQACVKDPLLLDEIEAIEKVLIIYAESKAPKISDTVKKELFSKLNGKPVKEFSIAPNNNSLKRNYNYAIAASIVLFIASSFLNILMYNKLQKTNAALSQLNSEKEYYASQFKVQQTVLKNTENDVAVLLNSGTKSVKLKATNKEANSSAVIYWNTINHETYLSLASLPVPPAGKQYQLWAIVNGKPVDAGVFDLTSTDTQLQKMKSISAAEAFAVTLENKGGSTVPTLTAMYLLGNV